MTLRDAQSTARAYIECVGAHDLDPLDGLLADDVVATFAGARSGKSEWIWALQRLLTIVAGTITEIELILDRVAFAPVNQELRERAAPTE